ncbi:MAG: helix-turn-helix domain-containing protein [Nitrococcus mobilis]|nr:helix-turn-helix domain-containing protein [Nitrococcus mobilis]
MIKLNTATKQLLKDPRKRRGWVIYQLTLRGSSLADVARQSGVRRQTLYMAFERPYPRMESLIAAALDLTPAQLWPERYDADGLPLRQRGTRRKSTTKSTQKQHTARTKARNTHANEVA